MTKLATAMKARQTTIELCFDVTLHSKEQICNVTSQILQQIDQFSSYLCVTSKQANLLHFEQTAYLFEM